MKAQRRDEFYKQLQEVLSPLFYLYKYFKESEQLILDYLSEDTKDSTSFSKNVINYLRMRDESFDKQEKIRKRLSLIKNLTLELELLLKDYQKEADSFLLNLNLEKLARLDKRTLREFEQKIISLDKDLIEQITLFEDITYNDYLVRKKHVKNTIRELSELYFIVLNLVSEGTQYKTRINLKELKQLSQKEINEGDIILMEKSPTSLHSFRKMASKLLSSNIFHSGIVFNKYKNQIYLFQGVAYNEKKTVVEKLQHNKEITYIVLRSKKKLTNPQIKKLRKLEENFLDLEYSYLKTLAAFFQRHEEVFTENFIFPRKRHKNPLNFLPGMFCSEVVVKAYNSIGIRLGFNTDDSIISPIDILNSPELEIVGYYK